MNFKTIAEWLLVIIMAFVLCQFILSSFAYGQEPEFGKWRWAEDTLQPTEDKQVHGVGSFGLYYLFTSKGMTQKKAVSTVIGLGLFKEGIDALVPWETYGSYGGDGFSKNDVVYNAIGVGSAYLIDRLWENKGDNNKSAYIEIYPRHVRFSIYLD
jgi:hypothetical protein